tara:strand:+ start:752 stop:1069 length:318 start_codon:yes stop_codon:yes gene_type:complete
MTKDFEFLLHMQRLMFEAEALAIQFGVKDRFLSIMVAGLLSKEDELLDSDMPRLKAIYSYNIDDLNELDEVQEFIYHTYHEPDKEELDQRDINDLLGGTGIELED